MFAAIAGAELRSFLVGFVKVMAVTIALEELLRNIEIVGFVGSSEQLLLHNFITQGCSILQGCSI